MTGVKSSVDPYQKCHSTGTNSYLYKQYDSASNSVSCCTANDVGVTALAKTQDTNITIKDPYDFLVTKSSAASCSKCDFSQYISSSANSVFFKKNYPDLYDNADVQRQLYNIIYAGDATLNASQLVPTFADKNISCTTGYVPYLVEVFLPNMGNVDYAYFCTNNINSVVSGLDNMTNGTDKVDYNLSQFETLEGGKCNTNSCNTKVASYLGQATHQEYKASSEKDGLSDGALIGFGVMGLVILILVIFLIVQYVSHEKIMKRVDRIGVLAKELRESYKIPRFGDQEWQDRYKIKSEKAIPYGPGYGNIDQKINEHEEQKREEERVEWERNRREYSKDSNDTIRSDRPTRF